MRIARIGWLLLVPAIAYAQPARNESPRWRDSELGFGAALVGAGYAASVVWAQQSDGDLDALYIPVIGPWLELFTLPDCTDRETFCAHSTEARSVLIASGAAQLVGVGLAVHALVKDRSKPAPVIVAPMSSHSAGVLIRGRF